MQTDVYESFLKKRYYLYKKVEQNISKRPLTYICSQNLFPLVAHLTL